MRMDKIWLDSSYTRNSQFSSDLTKWLWLDNKSFVIPLIEGFENTLKLVYITLFDDNTFSVSVRSIEHLKRFIVTESRGPGYHNYFGNFFALPFSDDYFYFVSNCPSKHKHSRLLLVHRDNLKIARYLELPGNLIDVVVDAKKREIFLSLWINAVSQYEQVISVRTPPTNYKSYKKLDCLFQDTWTCKELTVTMRKNTIFQISACGRIWKTSPCHNFMIFLAPGLDNSLNDALRTTHFMNQTAYGGKVHLTRDFIVAQDEKIVGSKLISRHHHFHYNNSMDNRLVKVCKAFYHPTDPIFLIDLCGAKTFQIHLSEWATIKDRQDFPSMKYNQFYYNQRTIDFEQRPANDPEQTDSNSD